MEHRFVVCAERAVLREGLKQVLSSKSMVNVGDVGSLANAYTLLNTLDQGAELLVCELGEDADADLHLVREIVSEFPEVACVLLADQVSTQTFESALAAGARGFLPRDISPEALRISIELVLLRENIFAAPIAMASNRPMPAVPAARGAAVETVYAALSPREAQILSCLGSGLPNKTIARNLNMAEATVKVHLKALMRKLNVANRTQAAMWSMAQTSNSAGQDTSR